MAIVIFFHIIILQPCKKLALHCSELYCWISCKTVVLCSVLEISVLFRVILVLIATCTFSIYFYLSDSRFRVVLS